MKGGVPARCVLHDVSPSEGVVVVDQGARGVEEDVAADRRLRRLGLDVEGALLLVQPHLPREIADHLRVVMIDEDLNHGFISLLADSAIKTKHHNKEG